MAKPKIMQYLNKTSGSKTSIVDLPISDTESIKVEVKTILSANDMASMVNSVVDALFDDDEYKAELFEMVFWKAVFVFYTDLNTNIQNDDLIDLIYNSDVLNLILPQIEKKQLEDIRNAIEKKADYKKQSLLFEQKQTLNRALDDIEFCTEKYSQLLALFEQIDIKDAFDTIKKVSNIDEQKLVNNIMEYKEKNNEH